MGEIPGNSPPYHSLKPICVVKSKYLIVSLALLSFLGLNQSLTAQNWQQKQDATNIISQLHKNQYTFSPQSTRFLSAKDARSVINENPRLSVEARNQLIAELNLDGSARDWRGVFSELITDCGSIPTLAASAMSPDGEVTGVLTIHLPPDNECSKLTDRLAMLIYGDFLAGEERNLIRCDTYECVRLPGLKDQYQCVQTIMIMTDDRACPKEETCEDYPDCESRSSGVIYPSWVYDKLFGATK